MMPGYLMALDRPDDDFEALGLDRRWRSLTLMRGGGEYGELTIELAASLAAHKTPVTPEERDELRALLEAMNMPTDPIEQLNVQG